MGTGVGVGVDRRAAEHVPEPGVIVNSPTVSSRRSRIIFISISELI